MTLCKNKCEDNSEVAELYRNEDGLFDAQTLLVKFYGFMASVHVCRKDQTVLHAVKSY